MALISINGNTLDPIAQAHVLDAIAPQAMTAKETNYILVQTDAPLHADKRGQLAKTGA